MSETQDLGVTVDHNASAVDELADFNGALGDPTGARGYLDNAGPQEFVGWIHSGQTFGPVRRIDLVVENQIVASGAVDRWRHDVEQHFQGDGRVGFRLPIPDHLLDGQRHEFDLRWTGSQSSLLSTPVVIRTGTAVPAAVSAESTPPALPQSGVELPSIVGYCDGIRGTWIYGWAWRPEQPTTPVEIELSIDDTVVDATMATMYRADLRVAGIGTGRYGWRLPFPDQGGRDTAVRVVTRVRGGEPLTNGVFEYQAAPTADDMADPALQSFIEAGLGTVRPVTQKVVDVAAPITHFFVHSAVPGNKHSLGAPEYSYGFVMNAFLPLLERIGHVHMLDRAPAAIDALVAGHRARGEASILLSFAPPHQTPLDIRCPIVPVVAWEFPTIPDRPWDGEARNDWRAVLRQTGRMIALCRYAADAVHAAMGADFPVVTIPTPVWDRWPDLHHIMPPPPTTTLAIDGFVLDTRDRSFRISGSIPPTTAADGAATTSVDLDGVVFTTVLAPKDGRKNWTDILTAFFAAHRKNPDVTLVMKMICVDAEQWWWQLHAILAREPTFDCRLVVLHGFLDEAHYQGLIAASHWVVNASRAEGQCLPLLEFMCAGRPAIAPAHTAMADYIKPTNALVVETAEEFCSWPHDPTNTLRTTRHRLSWESLVATFAEGSRLVRDDPAGYRALADDARATMRDYCSDEVVAARLDSFLGLSAGLCRPAVSPSKLLDTVAVAA